MNTDPFILEKTFHAPIHQVWEAISNRDQMHQWYFKVPEFIPEVGFEFQFEGGDKEKRYVHLCKITEVETGRRLAYSWRYQDVPGITHVPFDLFPTDSGTTLRLTHSGLHNLPKDNPDLVTENFATGWSQIIDVSLRDFVEKQTIHKSVLVIAPASKVWEVLIDPVFIKQWGNAFSEGTYVETDWSVGSEVVWKDAEGGVGAKGIVEINQKSSMLKVAFYDEIDSKPPTPTGEYSETFKLSENGDKTLLTIEAGLLEEKYISIHSPLWERAVLKIKALAEE